jgi:predicted Zn-dependent peptidase
VGEAIDLLTDFVGRPKIDAEELDRERGVVIQEIARAHDQPSVLAEHLIDRAAFGDHPLGRPVLGPEEHLRAFTRDAIVAFRSRQWAGSRGGAFVVGNLSHLPDDNDLAETFGRFPSISSNGTTEPAPPFAPQTLVESRDSNQSHLRISYRPAIDPRDVQARAALTIYSTLLGGSMGSRLFDEIREQRGLAYSVYSADHAYADVPVLQLSAGLESGKAVEAFTRMGEIVEELRSEGPREEEFERARTFAAGRRVLAFENTNAVARYAASQSVVFGQDIDPDEAIAALDRATFDQVAEVARGISETASVACVGPHDPSDFGG